MEDKDLELQDGSTIVYLNSKGQGDNISPVVVDLLNVMEQKPVETDYGKKLENEFIRQKENQKARESYMALTNMIKNAEIEARMAAFAEGRAEGIFSNAVESVRNMMETLRFTAEAAMDALKIKASERPAILAAL